MTFNIKTLIQPFIILALLAIIIVPKACNKTVTKVKHQKVEIPIINGKFEAQKPKEIKSPIIRDTVIVKGDTVYLDKPVDKEMMKKFMEVQGNSVETMKLYQNAIQIRSFTDTFEDKYIKIDMEAESVGKVNWMKPKYTIKPQTIDVPILVEEEQKMNLYGGIELTNGIKVIAPTIKGNIFIQKTNGDMYSFGVNNKKDISVGYIFKF